MSRTSTTCSVENCRKASFRTGLCHAHYRQARLAKKPNKCCTVEKCFELHYAKGLCEKHYAMKRAVDSAPRDRNGNLIAYIGKNGRQKGGPGNGQGNGAGGPRKLVADESTLKRLRDLGTIQCTIAESAGVMQCAENTLLNFLHQDEDAHNAFYEGRESGKASLRRMQFVMAKRSAAMAIWLGKNILGQYDVDRDKNQSDQNIELDSNGEEITALLRAVRSDSE